MKKVLFASTALVLTAGVAAAEVTISGSANMGVKYSEAQANSLAAGSGLAPNGATTTVHNEIDIDIKGSTTTSSGVELGASVDLDASSDDSVNTTGSVADPEVYVSAGGVKLTIGDIAEADDIGKVGDAGYDGIGLDDDGESLASQGSHDVRVDVDIAAIGLAVTMDSASGDWALAISGDMNGLAWALGYSDGATADVTTVALGYDVAALGLALTYSDSSAGSSAYALGVTYTQGDMTIFAGYSHLSTDANDDMGVGIAYDIGGATIAGGIGDVDGGTVADFGISFSF